MSRKSAPKPSAETRAIAFRPILIETDATRIATLVTALPPAEFGGVCGVEWSCSREARA